jgi:peptidoglycan/xylan/chitin deacetylase (PgdA/CDA1 family)
MQTAFRKNGAPPDVCITVDMEPDCPPFLWTWRGMDEGAPKLLDLFARHEIAATCFTTGDSATRFPDVAARIVADGHELACHGQTHTPFPQLDRDKARWEIETSAEILRAFGPVTSFRAPNLLFPHAYLSLLEEAGITLDSSDGKHKQAWWFGPKAPPTKVTRIPASTTSSVLRLPPIIRDRFLLSLASPVVLFVHPWEFVDFRHTDLRYDCRFRTGDLALSDLDGVISLFKRRGARFRRMRDLAPQAVAA